MKVPTYCRRCDAAMLAESEDTQPMCIDCKKMEVLMGLGIPSIVKINATTAMMKLPPSWECVIDVSIRSDKWVAKSKDGAYNWQNSQAVPDDIKDEIEKVSKMYNEVLLDSVEWEE